MAGYSATPLVRKLGIRAGDSILLFNTPAHYDHLILEWPAGIQKLSLEKAQEVDFIHFFTQEYEHLESMFPTLKQKLRRGGMLWISWPKGKSKLRKDLNENDVRRIGLQTGLVDVKVCAVDDDWSGLKFMHRKKNPV